MQGKSHIKTESKPHFYVIDTSFLTSIPQKGYWTRVAGEAITRPNSVIIVPTSVEREFQKFLYERGSESNSQEKIKETLQVDNYIPYSTKLRQTLAEKLDAEVEYLGFTHKSLSRTDKTIIQAAWELESQGHPVHVVTADEGIYQEARNLWNTSGKDIQSLSPWSQPQPLENRHILMMQCALEDVATLDMPELTTPTYLAIAKDIKFGNTLQNIAIGWYVNKTHQFTPPKIHGIEYMKMMSMKVFESAANGKQSSLLRLTKLVDAPTYGMFKASIDEYNNPDLIFCKNNIIVGREQEQFMKAIIHSNLGIPADTKKLVQSAKSQVIEWAKIRNNDLKWHNTISYNEVLRLRQELKTRK